MKKAWYSSFYPDWYVRSERVDVRFERVFARNSLRSINQNSNITPRLSGHISIFGLFSLCSSFFWELRDNGLVKHLQFCRLGVVLEFWYIERGLFNNYSSSPNGLWVDSPWGRRPNGLLTQMPFGLQEQLLISKIQLVGQKYRDKTTLAN